MGCAPSTASTLDEVVPSSPASLEGSIKSPSAYNTIRSSRKASKNSAEAKANDEIEKEAKKDHEKDLKETKLLLLGTGESGKSTLFRQLNSIYGNGLTQVQLNQFIPTIHQTVLTSINVLIDQSELLNERFDTDVNFSLIPTKTRVSEFFEREFGEFIPAEIGQLIKTLWKDPGIRKTFDLRAKFQLNDNCDYFFDDIDRITTPGYEPNFHDVLMCRIRSTGIAEARFNIKNKKFLVVDVGGQRNERRKWIHCFDRVTAVLFVAAINEYDQILLEDDTQNRMQETLKVFEDICKMETFHETPIILFLNKYDLFLKKLPNSNLSDYFPNYTGGADPDLAVRYIKDMFRKIARKNNHLDETVYCHVTCATDTENVTVVFNAVKDIFIQQAQRDSKLLM